MKNPWMSLWLSSANRAAGTARGTWMAEARRQQNALLKATEKAMLGGTAPKAKPAKTRRKSGS
jgi:hypothetical protein